jgi:arsenate reductase
MNPVVYAYTGCSTCRNALKWLGTKGVQPTVVPIRETPPGRSDLDRAFQQLGSMKALFNVSGNDYRELGLKDKLPALSTDQALELLSTNGNLVKRPFVRAGKAYLVGFRQDEWEKVFP